MASISPIYIKVNGLNDSISTDDIVAYFETARCGSGRVVEVVYQGRYNSVACVGLQEINADIKDKLLTGEHKICANKVRVQMYSGQPTLQERQKAAYKCDNDSSKARLSTAVQSLPVPITATSSRVSEPKSLHSLADSETLKPLNSQADGETSIFDAASSVQDKTAVTYFKISGLTESVPIQDIVSYFESAQCTGNKVSKVIYQGSHQSIALVGIKGCSVDSSDKWLKANHKIGGKEVSVACHPFIVSPQQEQNAVYDIESGLHQVSTPAALEVDKPQSMSLLCDVDACYITVSGLIGSVSVEDIVAYFQSARCGAGTVTEVVYVDQRKSVALVGISGLQLTSTHKLFKGSHRIQSVKVKVESTDTLPSLKQRQTAVYSFIPTSGSVSFDTKPQEVPPLVTVHSDHPTPGPPVLLDVDKHQHVSKTLSPSYITVSGLTDSISVEDIVAYFQCARCGGGTVTEVAYVDQRKSEALVGINGLELNSSHKLFKGSHRLGKSKVKVALSEISLSVEQHRNAVYSIDPPLNNIGEQQPTRTSSTLQSLPAAEQGNLAARVQTIPISEQQISHGTEQQNAPEAREQSTLPKELTSAAMTKGETPIATEQLIPPNYTRSQETFCEQRESIEVNVEVKRPANLQNPEQNAVCRIQQSISEGHILPSTDHQTSPIAKPQDSALKDLSVRTLQMVPNSPRVQEKPLSSNAIQKHHDDSGEKEELQMAAALCSNSTKISAHSGEFERNQKISEGMSHTMQPADPIQGCAYTGQPKVHCEVSTQAYHIIVSGLTDSIFVEDIVAYFQSARCGGGTVTEVVYLNSKKSSALVEISGIDFDHKVTHKLFNTKHSVKWSQITIKRAQHPPTTRQLKNAAYCAVYSGAIKMKSLHQSHALYDYTDSQSQLQKTTLSSSARGSSHNEPQEEQRKTEIITPMQHDSNSTCPMPDKIPPGLDESTATTPWPDITSSSDPFDKPFSANPFSDSMPSHEMSMPPLEIEPNADPSAPAPILSIKVEGLPEDWDEEAIEIAFDNPDCGGGSITSVSKDVITFQDPKVVERLVTKGCYEVMGHSFQLSLFSKEPDPLEAVLLEVNPGNTLVLHNVPNDVKDEHLCLFLGSICSLNDEEDFKISRKEGSPVILMSLVDKLKGKLAHCYDSLRNSKKLLNGKTKLRVERLDPVTSVIIDSIKDGKCKESHLKLYFGNKSKSGGEKWTDVKVLGKDKAVVTFSDPNSVWNVLALHPNHMKAFGADVSLQMYHPILNSHFLSTSGQQVPSSDATVYKHQPYNVSVSPDLHVHLEKTNDVHYFSKKLKDCCATATLDIIMNKHLIVISPSGGSEYIQYWKAACEAKVKDFLQNFREVPFDIPSAVANHVYPVVLANTQHLGVTVSLSATGGVVLVGKKEGVDKLKNTVEKIVNENLDKVLREPLPPAVLTYIDKCIYHKLKAEHPKIVIKVYMEQGILQVSGTSASCDNFMKIIKSLAPETVDVRLTEEAVVMLATQTGRALLYSKIGQLPVGHFFTGPDGSLAHGDTARVFKLHLVAEKVQMAINVAQQLQTTIAVEKHPVPKEFFNLLQSSAWNTTYRKLQSDFIAHLTPKADRQHVIIACDKQHLRYIKESIQTFCKEECFKDEVISLEHGEWEYLDKYSKSWYSIVLDMKSNKMEYRLPQSDHNMKVIRLHGEISLVRKYTMQIRAIIGTIAKEGREISRPGIARHFLSTSGKHQLTGIGSAHQAVVHLTTVDEQNKMDQTIRSSSAHRLLCTGTAGHCKVNVMLGDLTEFHVDVIVNAANENLNHGGGIAGAISQKGGPSIQEDCVRYINSHGLLSIGEAVLLKAVGTLPCKAIVHAVGPRWRNGQVNEEALLLKAVRESLKAAKNYKSVGLPAISSGIFGMPVNLCARAIMQGINEFFKDIQHDCTLSDVTIMLFEDKSVQAFISSAESTLQNVVKHDTSSVLSLRAMEQPSSKRFTRHGSGCYGVSMHSAVKLHKGSLTDYQADVYVNTAHCTLNLTHGAVAQTLLKAGGPALQAECNRYIAQHGNIPDWGYAVTGGGNLKCKHVIHAVGSQYARGSAEKGMETMMTNIIAECDRLQVSSVAFPAIGTGALAFPDNTVAKIMLEAISRYLQAHPSTTIRQIFLVIFMDRTHKAFQSQMHSPMYVYDSQDVEPTQNEISSIHHGDTPRYISVAVHQEGSDSQSLVAPSVVQSTALQSFKTNDVSIDIIHGDITSEDCDGIVSTSSPDLTLHPFGVMGALLKKGGAKLQQECTEAVMRFGTLSSSKVIVTGIGRPGGLKCRKILHVLAPPTSNGLQNVVKAVLRKADEEKLGAVSLPAIGTGEHGFTPEEAAEGICEAIVEFSKANPSHVNRIKVVLFQEHHYSNFSTSFTTAMNRKGIIKRAWNFAKGVIGYGRETKSANTTVLGSLPPARTKSVPPGVTENTVLCLKVYAYDIPTAKQVLQEVEDVVQENYVQDKTENTYVERLPREIKLQIEEAAKERHVVLCFDPAPLNQVIFKGHPTDVSTIKNLVSEELKKIEYQDLRRKHADDLVAKVQWQWKKDGSFVDYQPVANMEIEEAYQSGRKAITVESPDGLVTVDTASMQEETNEPPYSSVEIRRRDFEKERKEGDKPSTWDPMPIDPKTGHEIICHLVVLPQHSEEYKEVSRAFHQSLTPGGHVRGTSQSYQRIQTIQRIQNPKLWSQYTARKKAMDRENPQGTKNERNLFHGCAVGAVQSINNTGFNRSYAGANGTTYGKGMYFARDASYSARYAVSSGIGQMGIGLSHMYLACVLTGEYTTGKSSMIVPPSKDPSNSSVLFDSVVDNVQNPSIFVVFYDAQAYPEFLITFN